MRALHGGIDVLCPGFSNDGKRFICCRVDQGRGAFLPRRQVFAVDQEIFLQNSFVHDILRLKI